MEPMIQIDRQHVACCFSSVLHLHSTLTLTLVGIQCMPFVVTVLEGMDVVYKMEAVGSGSGKPSKKVAIAKSGELPLDDPPTSTQ